MPKINRIPFGLLLSLILTTAVYGILYLLHWLIISHYNIPPILSFQLKATIALFSNVFIFHFYDRRKAHYTARGILMFVILAAVYLVYNFFLDQAEVPF